MYERAEYERAERHDEGATREAKRGDTAGGRRHTIGW
jgi:hypothetical protein